MGYNASQMAQLSMTSQIGGAAMSAAGSYYGASVQKTNLQTQAYIANTNAQIAELGAQSALAQGQQQVAAATLRAGQLKSSQRASMAANGIDLGVGSAAEVQASTDIMKDVDKNTIETNALNSAWGYRTQAVNYKNQALMSQATASGISPFASTATSLLGSAGKVASSWYSLSRSGAIDTYGDGSGNYAPVYTATPRTI